MRFIGNAPVDGEVRAIASGALATGDTVVVNSDGTVSVVEETSVSQSVGSPTVYESAYSYSTSAAYDSNTQRVVVAYTDNGNANYGTAVVGTVSGTSISFGNPVVFLSSTSYYISIVYDANAQKTVIVYQDYSGDEGEAIVGTVSGTSISFGSPTVYASAIITGTSATYDANSQKIVIAYRDNNNSFYGTAIVGTVSGSSISFGSPTVFEVGNTQFISAAYDSNAGKIVIAYRDLSNSSYGTAVVGTVSGTSISFGSPVVFESADSNHISAVYDANAQKVVLSYQDGGNSDYGTAVVGTVSGTSISFGSPVVFKSAGTTSISSAYDANAKKITVAYADVSNSRYGNLIAGTVSGNSISFGSPLVFENAETEFISSAYDDNSQKVVVAYLDAGNSGYGTSVVFQNASTSTNLTSEGFVGFANSGYASGQSAAINSTCSVDKNQSGLTAGQTYYVQTDGSLGTTAGDPSVVAGTAISSTEIIVKG